MYMYDTCLLCMMDCLCIIVGYDGAYNLCWMIVDKSGCAPLILCITDNDNILFKSLVGHYDDNYPSIVCVGKILLLCNQIFFFKEFVRHYDHLLCVGKF